MRFDVKECLTEGKSKTTRCNNDRIYNSIHTVPGFPWIRRVEYQVRCNSNDAVKENYL